MTREQLEHCSTLITRHSVEIIDLKCIDLTGNLPHVSLPVTEGILERLVQEGVRFDGSGYRFRKVENSDMILVPDLGTAVLDPFRGRPTLSFYAQSHQTDERREVIPEDRRAEGIGYWGMSTMLATAVAPAVGLWMYKLGWAWLCAGTALLNLVMAAIAWRLPPDTTVAARLSRDRLLHGSLVEWRVVAVTIALFLCSFGYGGITSFVAVMSDEHGITSRSIFFTAFALTVLVTRVFSGRLADRVGHRRFLLPCLALATVGLGATALAHTRAQLVMAAVVFGLGFGNGQDFMQLKQKYWNPMKPAW